MIICSYEQKMYITSSKEQKGIFKMSLVWIKPVCKWFLLFLGTVEANIIVLLQETEHRYVANLDRHKGQLFLKYQQSSQSTLNLLSTAQLTASKTGQVT